LAGSYSENPEFYPKFPLAITWQNLPFLLVFDDIKGVVVFIFRWE
jgi:hypothetical protein